MLHHKRKKLTLYVYRYQRKLWENGNWKQKTQKFIICQYRFQNVSYNFQQRLW